MVSASTFPVFAQSSPSREEPGIHIPADKRHQNVSKYDLFPFTDRRKGDIDRYRAVNPNYVKKIDGRYYYLLDAKPGTHGFDGNLKDQGALTQTNVAVELTEVKRGMNKDGKPETYVYVRDKGYVLRSRFPSASEIRTGKWFRFPIKDGKHPVYDGTGIVRGTLASDAVRLNYGQQKQINGERCYYAFATSMIPEGATEKKGASGWIKASAIQSGNDPQYSAEVVTKMQPPPTPGATFTRYEVTGGDPEEKIGSDASGKPVLRFGYRNAAGDFIAYKVLPGVALAGRASIAATDYLRRNDAVINLGFNVAGVSNDTYRVSSATRRLIFHRASDRDATAVIDLYFPRDAAHDGLQPVGKMVFVYGYVDENGAKQRWGWMALGALKPL